MSVCDAFLSSEDPHHKLSSSKHLLPSHWISSVFPPCEHIYKGSPPALTSWLLSGVKLLYFIIYYDFGSPDSCTIPLAFQSLCSGIGSKPGRSQSEIMQPDNASRQSITLMARTMMPLRFLTNFKLLQLSICNMCSQQRQQKAEKELSKKTKRLPVFFLLSGLLLLVFISL